MRRWMAENAVETFLEMSVPDVPSAWLKKRDWPAGSLGELILMDYESADALQEVGRRIGVLPGENIMDVVRRRFP